MLGKSIKERVRRCIVRLARRTKRRGSGGEQHKRRQLQMLRQFVQIQSTVNLRREHTIKALLAQRFQHTVLEHTRGVKHSSQRMLPIHRTQQLLKPRAICDITRLDPHPRTQPDQLILKLTRTHRLRATPAQQQQMPHTVNRDQMPGQQTTQPTSATTNQDRPIRIHPLRSTRALPPSDTGQRQSRYPRHKHTPTTNSNLRLPTPQHLAKHNTRENILAQVDKHNTPRMLRLNRAHQTPQRRLNQTRHTLALKHPDSTPSQQHQPRLREPLISKPTPQQTQHPTRQPMHNPRPSTNPTLTTNNNALPALQSTINHHNRRHNQTLIHRQTQIIKTPKSLQTIQRPTRPTHTRRLPARCPTQAQPHTLPDIHPPTPNHRRSDPPQREHRIPSHSRPTHQTLTRHRPQHQRTHRRDQTPTLIRRDHRRFLTHKREMHTQNTRTRRKQTHTLKRKRQTRALITPKTIPQRIQPRRHRLNRSIKQRRMKTITSRLTTLRLRKGHLNKQILTTTPQRPNTRKHRPIIKTKLTHPPIKLTHIQRNPTHRRPHTTQQPHTNTNIILNQRHPNPTNNTTRMTRPLRPHTTIRDTLRPGKNLHTTTPILTRSTHTHLHLHRPIHREHERSLHHQLLHHITLQLVGHMQRQLHKSSTRNHNQTQHHMIPKPRNSLQRYLPSEQPTPTLRQSHRRTQQRMTSRSLPNRSQILHHRHPQPITLTLKRINRQPNPPRQRTTKHPTPINSNAPHPQLRQRTEKRSLLPHDRPATPVPPRHLHCFVGCL